MRKHRIHLVVTSWLPISEHYQSCAFTQKAIKFSKMMLSLGHEVYVYGVKSKNFDVIPCTEFIETHSIDDIRSVYGDGNNFFELGYDWIKSDTASFRYDKNGELSIVSMKFFESLVREIPKRYKYGDILCLTFGGYFKTVTNTLLQTIPDLLFCEYGIGYHHAYAPYRAFESSHVQNWVYGNQDIKDMRPFDRIIPNYFDPTHFPFVDREKKRDYLLYIGRLIPRKGIYIAIKLAEHTKTKLLMAGQGELTGHSEYVDYVGWADRDKRAALMAYAKAVVVPTVYLEPFGGVAIEAQMCGTPVITSNTGAFPETVVQGITGFRCDTFQEYVDAANKVNTLDPKVIRAHAERYSMDTVKYEYQRWFDDILTMTERFKKGEKTPFFTTEKENGVQ